MTSVLPEVAGFLAIIAALYILVRINERRRKVKPTTAELVADARIESALLDGWETEQRNHLAPLTNTEVNRRLGVAMDTAVAELRVELDREVTWDDVAAKWDQRIEEALREGSPTPIGDATAGHIAAKAAESIDTEWRELA